ncbi:sodium-dependent glucose transporter 1-like, partial [Ylistrum balloti]|uniref:sodium-dependent glucose transporter 1-like n=1 Tax=Ylistrum balloti TaxID=509963 RepID=UPI002905EC01
MGLWAAYNTDENWRNIDSEMEKDQEHFISTLDYEKDNQQKAGDGVTYNERQYQQTFFQKIQQNKKFRAKFTYSVVQCFAYMLLGWMKAQIGPSFSDILRIADASLDQGGIIRTIYYVGVVIGCLACAILFLRLPTPLLSAVIFAVVTVDIAVIPWCSNYIAMVTTHFIQGFCFGIFDTITFAEAVRIWKNNSKSYMQIVAFGFSLASVLSPLASAPFLTDRKNTPFSSLNLTKLDTPDTKLYTNSTTHSFIVLENNESLEQPEPLKFYKAYTITAVLTFIAFVSLLTVWIVYRGHFRSVQMSVTVKTADTGIEQGYSSTGKHDLTVKRKVFYLVLMSTLFAVYNSVDYTFTDFLTLFCVRQLHWTTKDGAFLTSIVFVASLFSRFAAIFLVRVIRLDVYMGILMCLLIGSFIGMAFIAHTLWSPGMWACSALVGVATGPIPGALVSWTHEAFVPVTGRVSSALLVAAFIGATINPPILTHLFA